MEKKITGLMFIVAGILTMLPIMMLFVFPKYIPVSEVNLQTFRTIVFLGLGLTTGVSISLITKPTIESTVLFLLGGFMVGLLIVLSYKNLSLLSVNLIVSSLVVGLPLNAFILWIKGFESLLPKFNLCFQ